MLRIHKTLGLCLLLSAALVSTDAHAKYKLSSPYVTKGKTKLEWRENHDSDKNAAKHGAWQAQFGAEYGITDQLAAGFKLIPDRAANDEVKYKNTQLELTYQFFEDGEYWLDAGIKGEYKIAHLNGTADSAGLKLLLGKSLGEWDSLANLSLKREVGEYSDDETDVSFAFGTHYHYTEMFQPGFEYHVELGELNGSTRYSKQKHLLGPVIYGSYEKIKYDVGVLAGISDGAPDATFKWVISYSF